MSDDIIFLTKTSFVQNYYVITRYDPIADQWTERASLNKRDRVVFGFTVLNRMLYVVGGLRCFAILNNVDRYNPKSNRWTSVKPMLTHRFRPGIC